MSDRTQSVLKLVKINKSKAGTGSLSAAALTGDQAEQICEQLSDVVNGLLTQSCSQKANAISESNAGENCACAGISGGAKAVVDLVVLIDRSGSMSNAASAISTAAAAGIANARKNCPTDLRVEWFGLQGAWAGTNFTQSSNAYLAGLPGVTAGDLNATTNEDGAKGVGDLARHFDWREGACRAVLYIGDEGLEQGDPHNAADDAAVAAAIADANANSVQVFTHRVTGTSGTNNPAKIAAYQKLATDTGGKSFNGPASVSDYESILEEAICNACGVCKHAPIDDIEPCISLLWGDSACDEMETSDYEKICFRVCNCYDNISFGNFTIKAVLVFDANLQPVATLPDGSPSVDITPFGPICFGDIAPCTENGATCVSREAIVHTQGAAPGGYIIAIVMCYDLTAHRLGVDTFNLRLCAS